MLKYKYRIWVNKQHSQSEMTAIPCYHLSQPGMKLIILLN